LQLPVQTSGQAKDENVPRLQEETHYSLDVIGTAAKIRWGIEYVKAELG
jgi:hypothetical protein